MDRLHRLMTFPAGYRVARVEGSHTHLGRGCGVVSILIPYGRVVVTCIGKSSSKMGSVWSSYAGSSDIGSFASENLKDAKEYDYIVCGGESPL